MVEHWAFHSVAILASMRAASKDHSVAVTTICSLECSMALQIAEMMDSSIAVMTVRLSAALLDVPTADSKASKLEYKSR